MSYTSNSNHLLKKQQDTTNRLCAILEQSTAALTCGPTCQKSKTEDQLKQKYLDAQTNMQTAPIQLENSKKNYYVFTEGEPRYDNMLEEDLKERAEIIGITLTDNFNEEVTNAKTMNSYYNAELINSKNSEDLYNIFLVKNKTIQESIKGQHGDVLTNDRKTYYETEALDNLNLWHKFFIISYYIAVAVFIIAVILSSSIDSNIKKVIFIFIAIIYPFFIDHFLRKIYGILHSVYKQLPKNVYNDL